MSHRHEYEAVTGSDDRDSLPTVSSLSNGEMEDWVQSITQDEVSAELQAAFKWAGVGFQARSASGSSSGNMEMEPFESEAFKKSATGLLSVALRLLGDGAALLSLLEVSPAPRHWPMLQPASHPSEIARSSVEKNPASISNHQKHGSRYCTCYEA